MIFGEIKKTIISWCKSSALSVVYFSLILICVTSASIILVLAQPSGTFPVARVITIDSGMTLTDVSSSLKTKGVIRSELLFKVLVSTRQESVGVLAGDYFFDKPLGVYELAIVFTQGDYGLTPETLTIQEGSTIFDIAELCSKKFSKFDKVKFLEKAELLEGYLYPDTYFFLPNVNEEQIIAELFETFVQRLDEVADLILASEYSINEIVIMASIIEKEAWKEHDQRLISGVLWNRINLGMLLQVDATFNYVNGKNTYELTYDDLKIDSPYNTYKYKGLPIGPISNPGLKAIRAALDPTPSDYLFYLADRNGNTYYAEDFDAHKKNRQLYMN